MQLLSYFLKISFFKRITILLFSGIVFLGISILYFVFISPPSKAIESYDRTMISTYQEAQKVYFEAYNKYGHEKFLGFTFSSGGNKLYENISQEEAKKIGLNQNQWPIINKDSYRVIVQISDCRFKNQRFWLVEHKKPLLKLKEVPMSSSLFKRVCLKNSSVLGTFKLPL